MRFKIQHMNEINIDAHAQLIFESRQQSPLRSDDRTLAGIKKALESLTEQGDKHVMIVAQDEESSKLLGQLLVWLDWGEIGVSMPWQPIVHPESNQESVAISLIEHTKKLLNTHSLTRLEIWMELTNEQSKEMSAIYIPWYEKSGFYLKAMEYYLESQQAMLNELNHFIPEEVTVVPMSDFSNGDLMNIVLDTFQHSSDKWFLSMTESQQVGSAEAWLKRDETFDNEGSIVFTENGEVIGYNVMRVNDNLVEVGPIGVIPSRRGKGLGRALLLESVSRLRSRELESIWLTVSSENSYAYTLYSGLGFVNKYEILIYTWMP